MQLRSAVSKGYKSSDGTTRYLTGSAIDEIDSFIGTLVSTDFTEEVTRDFGSELTRARSLWRRASNSEVIEDAFVRAQESKTGFENGLRDAFKSILRTKKGRFLSEAERELVREVLKGSRVGNLLRTTAGLSFGNGVRRNTLGGFAGSAAGGHVLGPAGYVAAPVLGAAAEAGAEGITNRMAQRVRDAIASGKLDEFMRGLPPAERREAQALLLPATRMGEIVDREVVEPIRQLAR
jgi:hypothetical protein